MAARHLVPGDIVLLEAGNVVPADGRLIQSANLRVKEAALTGDAEPVEKQVEALAEAELTIGDRRNMVFMGTQVTYGRGAMVVGATGMSTELGRIATLSQGVHQEATPLQQRLDSLGKMLAVAGQSWPC
jgi:Ca2+-transporting ATPase